MCGEPWHGLPKRCHGTLRQPGTRAQWFPARINHAGHRHAHDPGPDRPRPLSARPARQCRLCRAGCAMPGHAPGTGLRKSHRLHPPGRPDRSLAVDEAKSLAQDTAIRSPSCAPPCSIRAIPTSPKTTLPSACSAKARCNWPSDQIGDTLIRTIYEWQPLTDFLAAVEDKDRAPSHGR